MLIALQRYVFCLVLLAGSLPHLSHAQDLVDDLSAPIGANRGDQENLFTEFIKIISNSRRIFVLTNEQGQLQKGDFISLVIDGKLTARALVAKMKEEEQLVGIKILRIDSLANWARIRKGLAVQILRGDDSQFKSKSKDVPKEGEDPAAAKIKGEEDLFNVSNVLEQDIDVDEKQNRSITSDNIFGVNYGFFSAENAEGASDNYNMFSANWAHQIADDIWVEGLYGQALLNNFPVSPIETLVSNFTFRFKYSIKAPFYSFIIPYIGYQYFNVSSPEAGQNPDPNLAALELDTVRALRRANIIFGATALRRLVPGWFARLDVGTDIISGGVSIEF
jgi:hypothetical protein